MIKAPYAPVALDHKEKVQWEDTLAAMSWIAPGFVHVAYTMMNDGKALFTLALPAAAATDGFQLIFNPKLFFKYTLLERVFIVLHELMHEIENHCRICYSFRTAGKITVAGKSLDFDDRYSNYMQDYVINATLIASNFGTFNKDWLFDKDIADENTDWVEAYFRNWKQKGRIVPPPVQGGQGQGQPGQGQPQKGKGKGKGQPAEPDPAGIPQPGAGQFDCHLDPHASQGIDPVEAPERSEAQWEIAVNTAMEIQRAQGKLPAAMERWFGEMLKPKVDWTEHIEGLIKRIAGSGAYDWRKLDRRLVTRGIGAPGMTGHTAGLVIVPIDTSGSIYQDPTLIDRFFGELTGILEDVQPEKTMVIWCDAMIHRIDELDDAGDLREVYKKGHKGGGGTDFTPVFDHIAKEGLEPDMVVYLTDGYGGFPSKAPDYPVIWGDITNDDPKKYPFGTMVRVPVNQE